jgi:hypothetical protein
MTIDKLIHVHFLSLYVLAVGIFIVFMYRKLKYKIGAKELSNEKYQSTLTQNMIDTTEEEGKIMFNIWPFVNELKKIKLLPKKIDEAQLVYKVFRDSNDEFEHILLNTEQENHYIVIVVDLNKKKAKGYYNLNLQSEYSLA